MDNYKYPLLLMSAIIVSMSLPCFVCQSISLAAQTVLSQNRRCPQLGFQVSFPAAWTVSAGCNFTVGPQKADGVTATKPGTPLTPSEAAGLDQDTITYRTSASIMIIVDDISNLSGMTLEMAVNNRVQGLHLTERQLLWVQSPRKVDFAGVPAFVPVWLDGDNYRKFMIHIAYDLDQSGKRYVFAIDLPNGDQNLFRDDVDQIVDSFRISTE
jgi:hypothetical protein